MIFQDEVDQPYYRLGVGQQHAQNRIADPNYVDPEIAAMWAAAYKRTDTDNFLFSFFSL